MSNLNFSKPIPKDDARFDEFVDSFFGAVTNVPDPGDADGTLEDLTAKFNALIAGMREQGVIGG